MIGAFCTTELYSSESSDGSQLCLLPGPLETSLLTTNEHPNWTKHLSGPVNLDIKCQWWGLGATHLLHLNILHFFFYCARERFWVEKGTQRQCHTFSTKPCEEKALIKSDDHICHLRRKGIKKRGNLIIQWK